MKSATLSFSAVSALLRLCRSVGCEAGHTQRGRNQSGDLHASRKAGVAGTASRSTSCSGSKVISMFIKMGKALRRFCVNSCKQGSPIRKGVDLQVVHKLQACSASWVPYVGTENLHVAVVRAAMSGNYLWRARTVIGGISGVYKLAHSP